MTGPASVAFDARPLTEQVDRASARAFAKQLRAEGRMPPVGFGSSAAGILAAIVVGIFVIFGFGTALSGAFGLLIAASAGPASVVPLLLVLAAAGVGVAVFFLTRDAKYGRWLRLDRFARANGMSFVLGVSAPALPGMIFARGHSRVSSDLVRGTVPRFVEFGNYRYTTGSGKNKSTHRWGYVAVRLDVPLPHIVLDAIGNNGLFGVSNLPAQFGRDQRLSLEGDFDRFFALYCPEGYERDALYLFTPDIMARFIDNAAALDVEIVDDWLFLYAKRDLSTLDPATWGWLFSTVGAITDKLAQWGRWRDDRLAGAESAAAAPAAALRPPPGVAAQGRRLRGGASWVAFVMVGALVLWVLASQLGLFGSLLGGFGGR